ncbi:MAG TPA: DegQ family serine endoprotease [Nitrospirales bacterium]|nr:peptidase S1 [Nitrospiraceae bacterium]HNP28961.1 DegQ family serine endoprotease [Nitrospirales bacterium]
MRGSDPVRTSPMKSRKYFWMITVLIGLLGVTHLQCSQAPSSPPSDAPPTITATPNGAEVPVPVVHAADSPPVVNVSTPLLASNETFVKIAKEAMASVVNISATKRTVQVPSNNPLFEDPFFRRFFGEEFERRFQQPRERQEQGLGSGVIVKSDGYIVTNNHVVEQADDLMVLLGDKRKFSAKLIGTDPKTDLAVIKIEATDLPTLAWGNSTTLEVGELVLAVGNPFGLNQTVTMGIISAVGRANVGIVDYENFIQTDAAINPGNSGGALVNLQGQLIGINTAIFSRTGGYMGIGFAIPSQMVRSVMQSLIGHGKVVRGWLGVSIQELSQDLAKQFDAPDTQGTLVGDVFEESPAGQAGLKRGDIIRTYNGITVKDPTHLRTLVAETAPESTVPLTVWRNGKMMPLSVSITEMPKDTASLTEAAPGSVTGNHALSGLSVEPVKPGQTRDGQGVVVTKITPNSPAERAGLQPGDVILELNRSPIESVKDFEQLVKRLDDKASVLVLLQRGKGAIFLTIKP